VVISKKQVMLAAWMEGTTLIDSFFTAYSVSHDSGSTWLPIKKYKNDEYDLSGNPTVCSDEKGNLYVLVMSVKSDYSAGILELTISRDGGESWSEWKTVIQKKKMVFLTNHG
jgi:hypothetical protein